MADELDGELYVKIPLSQYHQLTGIAARFRKLVESNAETVEGAYRKHIAFLEREVERLRERELRYRQRINGGQ